MSSDPAAIPRPARGPASGRWLRRPWTPFVTTALVLVLTLWGWQIAHRAVEIKNQAHFFQRIEAIEQSIRTHMMSYEDLLRGGAGLFAATRRVSRADWRQYVDTLNLAARLPIIQGLGYIARVPPAGLDSYLRRQRADDAPRFMRHTLARRQPPGDHYIVQAIAPAEGNAAALGVDIATGARLRQVAEQARDAGEAILTRKLELNRAAGSTGFLLMLPAYAGGQTPAALAARRQLLQGWVVALFPGVRLFQRLAGPGNRDIDYRVFDGSGRSPGKLLYANRGLSRSVLDVARFKTVRQLDIAGRNWTILWRSTERFDRRAANNQPWWMLVAGLLLALLLFTVQWMLHRSYSRASRLAEAMTRDLRASKRKTRQVIDTANEAFVAIDADSRITDWNPYAERIFGWSRAEALGRFLTDTIIPPDFREPHRRGMQHFLATGEGPVLNTKLELTARHRDGHDLPVELTISPLKQGDAYIFNAFMQDISQRKAAQAELARSAEELARSNEELSQFAYVASHDLQEPLRSVTGFLELLQRRYHVSLDDKANNYIQRAVDGAQRMQALILDLLTYSRVGTKGASFTEVDCQAVLDEVLDSLAAAIEDSGARITHDPLPRVWGDATQLAQLLQNLSGNAIKFRGTRAPGVHIGVEPRATDWLFSVNDNGIGIAPEYRERVFAVFQRLHGREKYSGTGIGLAVCKKIVERHGGAIWVESESGVGTTFRFTLPYAPAASGAGAD